MKNDEKNNPITNQPSDKQTQGNDSESQKVTNKTTPETESDETTTPEKDKEVYRKVRSIGRTGSQRDHFSK